MDLESKLGADRGLKLMPVSGRGLVEGDIDGMLTTIAEAWDLDLVRRRWCLFIQ